MTPLFSGVFIALSDDVLHFACCIALQDPAADWFEVFKRQPGFNERMVLKCNRDQNRVHQSKREF